MRRAQATSRTMPPVGETTLSPVSSMSEALNAKAAAANIVPMKRTPSAVNVLFRNPPGRDWRYCAAKSMMSKIVQQ